MDVAMDTYQARPLAVECKFGEPYGRNTTYAPLKAEYFANGRSRWSEVGLPRCQELAVSLGRGVLFTHLDAGQLVKHLLGIAWTTKQAPRLIYLWFDTKCSEASEHRAEVQRFSSCLDPAVEFKAITYQDAFATLMQYSEPIPGYFGYLTQRYFGA
jgi:hypothetical protein